MIYLIVFSMTIALTCLYDHAYAKSKRLYLNILELIIILVPSLLGGFRATTVGSDNLNYAAVFQYASSHGLMDVVSTNILGAEIEKGFLILTWFLARIGNSFFVFAFGTSFITFTFVFKAIKYFRNRFSMTVMVMLYLFIYYCPLYNYVRQGIALALIFYAYRYVEGKNPCKFLLFVAFATVIHYSAIVSILIYVVFYFKDRIKFNKYVVMVIAAIFVIIAAGPQLIYNLLVQITNLGIRSETLLKYARRFSYISSYTIVPVHMVRAIPQLLISSCFLKKITSCDDNMRGYYILCWTQFIIMIFGCAFEPFSRLSLYFNYSEFVLFAALVESQKTKTMKMLIRFGLVAFCITYWVIFTVFNYYGFQYPVYPYLAQ